MKLYRMRTGSNGWLVDMADKRETPWTPGEDWRPATLRERIWFYVFHERFSWPEYLAGIVLVAMLSHDYLDWLSFILLSVAAAFVIAALKGFTEPSNG